MQTERLLELLKEGSQLAIGLSYVQVTVLGLKTLPLLLASCSPSAGRRKSAGLWTVIAAGVLLLAIQQSTNAWTSAVRAIAALTYYILATACIYLLRRPVGSGVLRKDGLFCVLAFIYLFVPAPVLNRLGHSELLVFGWTALLSSFSYLVETTRPSRSASLRDFMFFVLVDPTVSFLDRAKKTSVLLRSALVRLVGGALLMIAAQQTLNSWSLGLHFLHRYEVGPTAALFVAFPVAFLVAYWVRAGSAHVRIAMMQTMGYQPPECFIHPYAARNPVDFWHRWNRWVGDWARRYLFFSIALFMARRGQSWRVSKAVIHSGAVLASFGLMGVLHDLVPLVSYAGTSLVYTKVFLAAAVGILLWEGLAIVGQRYARLARSPIPFRCAANASTAAYVMLMFVLAGRI